MELDDRWIIKNPPREEADCILACDEWPWFPCRPDVEPPRIFRFHTQWCVDHGYCCGNRIEGDPPREAK